MAVPVSLPDIITAKNETAATMAALGANPRPDYEIDSQRVDWQKMQTAQIAAFRETATIAAELEGGYTIPTDYIPWGP